MACKTGKDVIEAMQAHARGEITAEELQRCIQEYTAASGDTDYGQAKPPVGGGSHGEVPTIAQAREALLNAIPKLHELAGETWEGNPYSPHVGAKGAELREDPQFMSKYVELYKRVQQIVAEAGVTVIAQRSVPYTDPLLVQHVEAGYFQDVAQYLSYLFPGVTVIIDWRLNPYSLTYSTFLIFPPGWRPQFTPGEGYLDGKLIATGVHFYDADFAEFEWTDKPGIRIYMPSSPNVYTAWGTDPRISSAGFERLVLKAICGMNIDAWGNRAWAEAMRQYAEIGSEQYRTEELNLASIYITLAQWADSYIPGVAVNAPSPPPNLRVYKCKKTQRFYKGECEIIQQTPVEGRGYTPPEQPYEEQPREEQLYEQPPPPPPSGGEKWWIVTGGAFLFGLLLYAIISRAK